MWVSIILRLKPKYLQIAYKALMMWLTVTFLIAYPAVLPLIYLTLQTLISLPFLDVARPTLATASNFSLANSFF